MICEKKSEGHSKAPFTRDRTNVYPNENSSGLLRLHGSAKKFVPLTFPFTWELPESIRKAAFRIPTAETVVHRSTDSNIYKNNFNSDSTDSFSFMEHNEKEAVCRLHGTGRIFNRYKLEFFRFRRWTKI